MKPRGYPISPLGTLCLGLTGAVACASDPIVGEWSMTEMEGDPIPLTTTNEEAAVTYAFSGGLTVFEDLTGLWTTYDSTEQYLTYVVGGSAVIRAAEVVERTANRVWIRSGEEINSDYRILFQNGDLPLDCTLTEEPLLTCQNDEMDGPAIFARPE